MVEGRLLYFKGKLKDLSKRILFCGYLPRRGLATNVTICVRKSVSNPFDIRSCSPDLLIVFVANESAL